MTVDLIQVLSLRMLLHDRDAKLVVMERALQHQRELLGRSARTAKMEMNLRCKAQKVPKTSEFQFLDPILNICC